MDVVSSGGVTKHFEIHPDPDRLRRYGVTLKQIQDALSKANLVEGADFVLGGQVARNVRAVGLLGGGLDPMQKVLRLKDPDPRRKRS